MHPLDDHSYGHMCHPLLSNPLLETRTISMNGTTNCEISLDFLYEFFHAFPLKFEFQPLNCDDFQNVDPWNDNMSCSLNRIKNQNLEECEETNENSSSFLSQLHSFRRERSLDVSSSTSSSCSSSMTSSVNFSNSNEISNFTSTQETPNFSDHSSIRLLNDEKFYDKIMKRKRGRPPKTGYRVEFSEHSYSMILNNKMEQAIQIEKSKNRRGKTKKSRILKNILAIKERQNTLKTNK
ncbi:hypothetical protein C9374_007862 [Naegleria lovaniensis]|uniref:Uncharacterized protein n=1 Tax=Naegleria lovaniensis TaxID=51637 RepID=A0AA88GG14_NAELO|nr:uncharacterized protein C9374_007862 [Naegleria lovaniensis]KAG2378714.1 hypothetical protein C9374_007862 [Naegleria lovaniensis]